MNDVATFGIVAIAIGVFTLDGISADRPRLKYRANPLPFRRSKTQRPTAVLSAYALLMYVKDAVPFVF